MKAAQRAPYLAEVDASYEAFKAAGYKGGHTILCGDCRFFRYWSPTPDEPYGDVECEHPLATSKNMGAPDYGIGPIPWDQAWEGGDCWGFSPTAKAKAAVSKKAAP